MTNAVYTMMLCTKLDMTTKYYSVRLYTKNVHAGRSPIGKRTDDYICIYNTVQSKSGNILYIYTSVGRYYNTSGTVYVRLLISSSAAVSLFLSARRHGANVAVDILDSKTKSVAGSNDPFDGEVAMCTHDRRYKIFERY